MKPLVWLVRGTAASAWVAALGLAIVVATVGPYLAMGALMYAGTPEPLQPDRPYPWGWQGALLAFALGLGVAEPILHRRALAWWAVAAALVALGLAGWQLVALVEAARP